MATNPTHSLFAPALLMLLAATSLQAQATPTVEARLAAARLYEARGELSKAADELQQALAAATEAQRAEVAAQQARLRKKLGADADAPSAARAQEPGPYRDPVLELIAVLDSGAQVRGGPVANACEQLQSLGGLAVPPLLDALPKLGPFGLANAMWVLQGSADARVAAALQRLMADNDAAVVSALVQRLYSMRQEVAVPVAKGLVGRELSADAAKILFQVLRKHEPAGEAARAFGRQLVAQPEHQEWVLDELDKGKDAVAVELLAELMRQAKGPDRAAATTRWLRLQPELQEKDALAHLAVLDEADRWLAAIHVVTAHPQWIEVGLVALRGIARLPEEAAAPWFGRVEWHRRPDEVAALLLAVAWQPGSAGTQGVQRLLADLLTRGWQPPAAAHEVLDRLMMAARGEDQVAFVRSIPAAAEDRALATWQRLDAGQQRLFVLLAIGQERPWHRLVARQLAACTQARELSHEYLRRDWTGAPAEVVATLVALVERFPSAPDGNVYPWHGEVIRQYVRCSDLPGSLVMPMVRQGNREAWNALARRHPQEALAHAREDRGMTLASHVELDALLGEHGTVDDVPCAVRLARGPRAVTGYPGIQRLLLRVGRGRVDVVALAAEPELNSLHSAAYAAAEGLTVAQLGELLPLLPKLEQSVRSAVNRAIAPQLRAEHGLAIATAMQQWYVQPNPEWNTFEVLNDWLVKAADPRCLSVLRPLLTADVEQRPGDWIARTMLQIAGDQRRALVEELLASPLAKVVAVAAEAPELRGDAALLAKAKAAVLRVAGEADFDDDLFAGLSNETAADWARAILGDERLPTFGYGVVQAAVVALRRTGAEGAAPLLARAALHRDAATRTRAAQELGNLFQREAAPFLIDLLKDEDPNVRKQAQESLDQLAKYLDARAEWEKRLK